MSTTERGRLAESAAADYLVARGFRILACAASNWRQIHHYAGDSQIDVVCVSGASEPFTIEVMENVTGN